MPVRVEDVTVRFGGRTALHRVNASFTSGNVSAIYGPNGSGKSTLVDVLAGLRIPDEGRVQVPGQVALVRQNTAIDRLLTPRENLAFYAAVQGVTRPSIDELLEAASLADRAHDRTGTLSGGMQRRVDLLRAVVTRPAILLLDEPTAGLDRDSRRGFVELVKEQTRSLGMITIWITHFDDERSAADHVFSIEEGVLTACSSRSVREQYRVTTDLPEPLILSRQEAEATILEALDQARPVRCEPIVPEAGR